MCSSRHLVAFFGLFIAITTVIAPGGAAASDLALMRLDLDGPAREVTLPVHALLRDADGVDYALVLASAEDGAALGAEILDPEAADDGYLVALERRLGARQAAAERWPVLLDDGRRIVLRKAPGRADHLQLFSI